MNIKIDIALCRVCLKQGPGTNIYTGNILEKFLFTTLVQVEKNDGLSEIICKKCLARLQIAYDFKKTAIASYRELRSFISNVNKQFKQVTGSGSNSGKSIKRPRSQDDGSESFDELDEDMQELLDEEQEANDYKELEFDLSDENKKTIDRNQLVEILGANNARISPRKTKERRRMKPIQEDGTEDYPENVEVYLVDENSEVESEFIVDESDPTSGELITDDIDEAQYLEDDENDDQICDVFTKPKSSPQKSSRMPAGPNPENKCDVCSKTFSTRTNLTRHRITHEGKKPYVCNICGNAFTQNGSLKSHMFIHTGERPFQCEECGKAFTQSKSLVFHMRRHTGEKPFECEYCAIKFRQKDGLKRHVAAKHVPNRSKCHTCDTCGKVLLSKYALNMHVSRHSSKEIAAAKKNRNKSAKATASANVVQLPDIEMKMEDPKIGGELSNDWDELYGCEYCDQAFTNSSDLEEHREIHAETNDDHIKYMEDSNYTTFYRLYF